MLDLDVEGVDLDVLRRFDFGVCRPIVIVVEPSDDYAAEPPDEEAGDVAREAMPVRSDLIDRFLGGHEYFMVARTQVNMVFVDARRLRRIDQDPRDGTQDVGAHGPAGLPSLVRPGS